MSEQQQNDEPIDPTERALIEKLRRLYRNTRKRGIYKTGAWLSVRENPRGGQMTTRYECDGDDL
jgi:hypothetical protein